MLFLKKFPWASLFLLVFTYGLFGWLISAAYFSWFIWLMGVAYILLIALALTAPFDLIQSFYSSWLQSDTRAFISIIIGSFLFVIILCWIQIFIRILILISASALVRLDLQTAGYTKWQAFSILVIVSLAGFGLGLLTHQFLKV